MREHFRVDRIALRAPSRRGEDEILERQFGALLTSGHPATGRITAEQRLTLFGSDAPDTLSAALIPLAPQSGAPALLGLGRNHADGFRPDQGLLFLTQIGRLATAVLDSPD
jgi:uncharacterized protein YigA (DUF484 family)